MSLEMLRWRRSEGTVGRAKAQRPRNPFRPSVTPLFSVAVDQVLRNQMILGKLATIEPARIGSVHIVYNRDCRLYATPQPIAIAKHSTKTHHRILAELWSGKCLAHRSCSERLSSPG